MEFLKYKSVSMKCCHDVGLSELESISIDDGLSARDTCRREDNLPLTVPAILRMRSVLDGLSLDMMIVRRESRGSCASLFFPRKLFSASSVQVQCKFLYSRCI